MISKARRHALLNALLLPLALGACSTQLPKFTTMADGAASASAPAARKAGPTLAQIAAVNVRVPASSELMGKGPGEVRRLMGAPSLLRKEGDAQVWQYAGTSCVVFLYLYQNKNRDLEVTYLDARAKTKGAVPVEPCLGDAVRTRAASGIS